MSIRYIVAVLDCLPDVKGTEALVLIALADYASDDTRECWPSVATVARRAKCDRRTAQRCLKALELRGLIDRAVGGHQYGRGSASRYRLKFDHSGRIAPDVEPVSYPQGRRNAAGGAASHPDKGGVMPPQGRRNAAPSVIRSVIDPKSDETSPKPKTDPRELTDAELEQLAQTGKLTAAQERERELRRRMASSKRRRAS